MGDTQGQVSYPQGGIEFRLKYHLNREREEGMLAS